MERTLKKLYAVGEKAGIRKAFGPSVFLLFWTYVGLGRPQDIFFFLRPFRLAVVSIALTFIGIFAAKPEQVNKNVFRFKEARIFVVFLAWIIVTIALGHNRRMGLNFFVYYYAINAAFFFAVLMVVKEIRHVKALIWVLIFSAFGLALASLALSSSQRISVEGGANDPNDLALLFVTALPLMVYMIPRVSGLKKALLIAAFIVTISATVFTYSRGGFLGLVTVSLLILARGFGFRNNALKFGAVAVAVAALFFLAPASFWERIGSIGDEAHIDIKNEHYMFTRKAIWIEGLQMLARDPLAGVGFGAFGDALAYFRLESGGIPKYQTAHNSYIWVAVETGIVGFTLYMALIVSSVLTFRKIWRAGLAQKREDDVFIYANMLEVSMWGWIICAFFLSQSYSTHFLLFPALAAVMRDEILVKMPAPSAKKEPRSPKGPKTLTLPAR